MWKNYLRTQKRIFFLNLKSNELRPEFRNCQNGVGFTFLSPPFLFSSLNTNSQKLICRQSSREDLVFALGARKGTLSDERVQKSLVFVVIYFALFFFHSFTSYPPNNALEVWKRPIWISEEDRLEWEKPSSLIPGALISEESGGSLLLNSSLCPLAMKSFAKVSSKVI